MEVSVPENMEDSDEEVSPFVESGNCSDEIVLKFDEGNELFVSQNFLSYASPVFKAMFKEGFKENEEGAVKLKGKDYNDMLELLLCIHPAILKPVDRSNVLRLLAYADEYQMSVIEEKCEKVLKKWLTETKKLIQSPPPNVSSSYHYQKAGMCLKVLALASKLQHEDLTNESVEALSLVRFKAITGKHFTTSYERNEDDPASHRENCAKEFGDLPEEIKVKVLSARLHKCDGN